jgi:S-adenosylmethionine-diacylglycerol 3-amino-3-carboxypropyl transferase
MKNKPIQQRASFEIIRYASCWEDADVLVKSLDIQPESHCLSIASGGDNAFAMLAQGPAKVTAVDLSLPQIAVVELKKASFEKLDHGQMLSFVGVHPSQNRNEVYNSLRELLSEYSQDYFDNNPELIANGIIHQGKFEHYFHVFRKRILPLVHRKNVIKQLLTERDTSSRHEFFNQKWNTLRWKLIFKLFFSRFTMAKLGRDKEFFKYVDTYMISDRLARRAKHALTVLEPDKNPYLKYILTGNYDSQTLPYYLRAESFDLIKKYLDRLELIHGSFCDPLSNNNSKYDRFNLSDIFEYMSDELFADISHQIIQSAPSGAKLAYWNMMVDRKISKIMPEKVKCLDEQSQQFFEQDKAFFYKAFFVEEVI